MTPKTLAGAALLVTPLLGLTGICVMAGGIGPADASTGLLSGSVCATSGPVAGLSDVAAANARVVTATAASRGGSRAALIALMTGLTESGLRILSNPNDPSGNRYVNQGVGHDRDSLGIFQQRPSWGPAAERMDPVASTNLFLTRLLSLPDWQSLPPWEAAQRVQASAFANGSNYRAQLDRASRTLAVVSADAATLNCGGSGIGRPPPGPLGAHGLPLGYAIPAGASVPARAAVTFALAQRGKPYVFGAAGPTSYDCSGLMQASWASAGVALSRTTSTQRYDGSPTTASRLVPGDLVLTPGADGTPASPGHVGMFLGAGLVVEAPQPGDVVKVVTYASFTAHGVSVLRHIA